MDDNTRPNKDTNATTSSTASEVVAEADDDGDPIIIPPRTSTPYSVPVSERVNLRHRNLPKPSASTSTSSPIHSSSSSASSSSPPKAASQQTASSSSSIPQPTSTSSETKPPSSAPTPEEEDGGMFECNICLDTASSPVVTLCGHLFCWPCLSKWIASSSRNGNTCPVCKAGIEKDKLIPIYCKGKTEDPRNATTEERPAGQRPEAVPRPGMFGDGFNPFFGGLPGAQFQMGGTNIHFSAGFGPLGLLFPLIGMGLQYFMGNRSGNTAGIGGAGIPAGGVGHDARMAQAVAQQAFISRVFLLIAALVFVAIILY
ncbi:hypothetical protein HDU99_006145 [Rhizoclosmatium hyalinum]|nr:hypothetical protein HDU99_006145 [Rhizoclosmatium hyalinum]